MPASSVFLAFLAEQAANLVIRQARGVLDRMPWAKDARRVESVERKIAVLVDRVAEVARNVPVEASEPMLEPLIAEFRRDLALEKIPESEAELIVNSVRAQIRTEVLRPLQDANRIITRLETLEREHEDTTQEIGTLRSRLVELELAAKASEKQTRSYLVLNAVSLTLAAIAAILALLALGRS